jgi:anti-anti-sigma factor
MPQRRFVSIRRDADVLTLKIEVPELRDPELAYAVRDELVDIVGGEEAKHLVFDLTDVTYMGSVGLLALLAVRRMATAKRIVLCNLGPTVRGIIFTSRLASTDTSPGQPFEFTENHAQALAVLGTDTPPAA